MSKHSRAERIQQAAQIRRLTAMDDLLNDVLPRPSHYQLFGQPVPMTFIVAIAMRWLDLLNS